MQLTRPFRKGRYRPDKGAQTDLIRAQGHRLGLSDAACIEKKEKTTVVQGWGVGGMTQGKEEGQEWGKPEMFKGRTADPWVCLSGSDPHTPRKLEPAVLKEHKSIFGSKKERGGSLQQALWG